jgi:hypothetical protein
LTGGVSQIESGGTAGVERVSNVYRETSPYNDTGKGEKEAKIGQKKWL